MFIVISHLFDSKILAHHHHWTLTKTPPFLVSSCFPKLQRSWTYCSEGSALHVLQQIIDGMDARLGQWKTQDVGLIGGWASLSGLLGLFHFSKMLTSSHRLMSLGPALPPPWWGLGPSLLRGGDGRRGLFCLVLLSKRMASYPRASEGWLSTALKFQYSQSLWTSGVTWAMDIKTDPGCSIHGTQQQLLSRCRQGTGGRMGYPYHFGPGSIIDPQTPPIQMVGQTPGIFSALGGQRSNEHQLSPWLLYGHAPSLDLDVTMTPGGSW